MLIFRPWRTTKDGKRIYAKAYGKKAFPIWVDDESENEPQKDSPLSAIPLNLFIYLN